MIPLEQENHERKNFESEYKDKINKVYDEEAQHQDEGICYDKSKENVTIPLESDHDNSSKIKDQFHSKSEDTNTTSDTYNRNLAEDTRSVKRKSKKYVRYMGKTCGFLSFKGEPIFTLGPHFGLFLLTWSCMTGFSFYIYTKIVSKQEQWIQYITLALNVTQCLSYLGCALINPGIKSAKEGECYNSDHRTYCEKCKINKEDTTYHCPDCDICIFEFDHHCPWTGKCIGGGNIFLFKIFITTTMIWFFYSLIILAV